VVESLHLPVTPPVEDRIRHLQHLGGQGRIAVNALGNALDGDIRLMGQAQDLDRHRWQRGEIFDEPDAFEDMFLHLQNPVP